MSENRNKELLKGTGVYAIGTFGTKILSVIIVPLYTYYISTRDMGVYDLLVSTVNLLAPVITLQISDAAYRWIIRREGDNSLYIRSAFQVLIFNCVLAFILVYAVNSVITIPFCAYFALLLVFTRIFETTQKILRALKRQKLFAASGILYSSVFLSLNLLQICVLKKGIDALLLDSIIASTITTVFLLAVVKEIRVNIFRAPDLSIIRDFYRFSIPLVPNYLNWWVINSSDRYIVASFLGVSANGILAITHKFPTLLQTVLNLFTASWQDIAVSEKNSRTGDYYTKVFRAYSRFVLSSLWFIIPATKIFIFLVMSEAYKESCNYVSFYYLGAVFQSFASFYGVGYLRNKQTGKAFSTSICGAVINAVANISLIRFIGLHASAVSTFLGFLIMWLIREKQNREELGIRIDRIEMTSFTMISAAVSLISIKVNYLYNGIMFLIGAALFLTIEKNTIRGIYDHIRSKKRIK